MGTVWAVSGVIVLSIIILIMINFGEQSWTSLLAILEIPCWFLIWEGMGKIFLTSKDKQPELDFFHKMSEMSLEFISY